jgi:hypothetical protein
MQSRKLRFLLAYQILHRRFVKQSEFNARNGVRFGLQSASIVAHGTQSGLMDKVVEIRTLTRFETSADGNFIKLIGAGPGGQVVSLNFVTDSLSGLLVTLPRLLASAERFRRKDPSVRLVFGPSRFELELGTDRRTRILTLTTQDSFSVSFGLSETQCREIAERSDDLRVPRMN